MRALELDETLPEAHVALAVVVENYDWDWQTAEREYRRAIELNPSYATAHHWYAELLGHRGRLEEALAESERARQLDPLSLIIAADYAMLLYYSRQYDRAIEKFRAVLAVDPRQGRAHMIRFVYVQSGMYREALADVELSRQMRKEPSEDRAYWSGKAFVTGRAGQIEASRHAIEQLVAMNRKDPVDPAAFVTAYLGLADTDKQSREEVFVHLQRALKEHSNVLITLKVEPMFDPLKDDLRFQKLLKDVGLN